MAYKNIDHNFSFADIAIQKFADKNRSMLFLRQVNNSINWDCLLMKGRLKFSKKKVTAC